MPDDGGRGGLQDLAVTHPHPYRVIAVETRTVDLDFLAGIEPADR